MAAARPAAFVDRTGERRGSAHAGASRDRGVDAALVYAARSRSPVDARRLPGRGGAVAKPCCGRAVEVSVVVRLVAGVWVSVGGRKGRLRVYSGAYLFL